MSKMGTWKPPLVLMVLIKVIFSVMPLAEFSIGAIYQRDCPLQRFIPVYLLVVGVVSILLFVLALSPCTGYFGNHSELWNGFVCLFYFCWFIAGNVWVYSVYEPNYNKTVSSENYCNRTLYLFAFWTITVKYIVFGLVLLSACHTLCLQRGDEI